MPYEFSEYEYEPEPQTSSSLGARPPGRWTAAGLLDPPVPPRRPPGPTPTIPWPVILRIFAALLLAGIAAAILFALLHSH